MMHKQRIKKVQNFLREHGGHAFLVSNPKNIFYCTGVVSSGDEREVLLLVTKTTATLFVSPLSFDVVKKKTAVRCVCAGEGLHRTAVGKIKSEQRIFFEDDDLSVRELAFFKKNTKSVQWKSAKNILMEFRSIKDMQEIRAIKKACTITDSVFDKVVQFLKRTNDTHITEQQLAEKMLQWGREIGGDDVTWAFDPIIASGSHSAVPHHVNTTKKLQKNAPLLLDFGFRKDGYNADLTRTVFLGSPSKKFIEMYDLVVQTNEECMLMALDGVTGAELHAHAVNIFQKNGVEKNFVHALGHGLGIDVHELPHVSPHGAKELENGHVMTIEPGLYFPGQWGIRIEDDILITHDAKTILTESSRDLIIL